VWYDISVVFRGSAFKHGVTPEAIEHAIEHWLLWRDNINDTANTLIIGPDLAANFLEILAEIDGDDMYVFHAMPARPRLLTLLDP
jgi:hypothetical protein